MVIEIYSREGCNKCIITKALFKKHEMDFVEFQIGVDVTRDEVLERFPDVRQLPIVLVNGTLLNEEGIQDVVKANKYV